MRSGSYSSSLVNRNLAMRGGPDNHRRGRLEVFIIVLFASIAVDPLRPSALLPAFRRPFVAGVNSGFALGVRDMSNMVANADLQRCH